MARNKVQFQKGLSEAQFAVLYGTEDQCREAVMRWRWPSGFVCPVCAGQHHSFVKTRALYQCTACRRQTSVIAGTIFAATKVPLCTWFRAMMRVILSAAATLRMSAASDPTGRQGASDCKTVRPDPPQQRGLSMDESALASYSDRFED